MRGVRVPARGLALLLLASLLGGNASAEPDLPDAYTRIGDTGVRLRVPEGFRVADAFPGIGRDEDLTSLLVTALAVPLAVSRETFDAASLAERGIRVDRIARVEVDDRTGWLAHATQRTAGVTFRKWILLLGDDTRSVMLTATTPLDLEAVHQRALVETLRTARWSPGDAEQGATLPFRIDPVAPLRIVRSSGNSVVLSDPDFPAEGRVPPLVAVGASRAQVQIGDLAGFARARLEETATLEEIEISSEAPRELDGMPGHEIRARALDARTGRPVTVLQLLATDGARYFLVQGIADADASEGFASRVETLIASFERVPPPEARP